MTTLISVSNIVDCTVSFTWYVPNVWTEGENSLSPPSTQLPSPLSATGCTCHQALIAQHNTSKKLGFVQSTPPAQPVAPLLPVQQEVLVQLAEQEVCFGQHQAFLEYAACCIWSNRPGSAPPCGIASHQTPAGSPTCEAQQHLALDNWQCSQWRRCSKQCAVSGGGAARSVCTMGLAAQNQQLAACSH